MWEKTAKKVYPGVKKEDVWKLWKDVNSWIDWNPGFESCVLLDSFEKGGGYHLKPKGGPVVKFILEEVVENVSFIDCTHLPGAKMVTKHEMRETGDGLELKTTVSISGVTAMMWVNVVGEKVAAKMVDQMDALVAIINK